MTLLQETEGNFSDSYLHQLSLPLKLVKFFGERFQIAFNGFFYVGEGFFAVLSLANCSREFHALRRVSAFWFLPKNYCELPTLNFHHKLHTTIKDPLKRYKL